MLKSLVLATSLLVGANANIKADSSMGKSLLKSARRLEDGDDDGEIDYTYVANYSIKFQGCHHVSQWNAEVDEDNDVRMQTVRLARFRLCPSGTCSNDKAIGCTSGFGDYIVDLDTFLASYLQDKQETEEYNCEYAQNNICGCDADDVDDEDTCLNTCYANNGLSYCIEDEDEGEQFQAVDYAACAQYEYEADDDANRRRLDEAEEEVQYFIGAYCANQGGDVRLGFFSDDTCTTKSETSYSALTGSSLPYSTESLVSSKCVSCKEVAEEQDENGDDADAQDEDQVKEMCEEMYTAAGKCESYMGIQYPTETACNYLEGIKITTDDGIIRTSSTRASKGAAVAIGLFATTAILLGAYVHFLQTKLGSKVGLLSQ